MLDLRNLIRTTKMETAVGNDGRDDRQAKGTFTGMNPAMVPSPGQASEAGEDKEHE